MALAGSLFIEMSANVARLQSDMNQAKGMVGSSMKSIESAVSSAKSVLASLGIGLGVGYFVTLIKGSIDALDHLHDLSKTTDLTVESLSGLRLASKQSGGDLDSIAASINKLSQNMGKDAEKFKALGVSAKDPLEAFKQLSDIFVAIKDPQQRAAVMAEALGKSWAGAAPLLAEGGKRIGEMVERGTQLSGVTKEMTDQADALNDKWAELTGTGGLLTRMVGPLLPLMNFLADDMLKSRDGADALTSSINPLLEILRVLVVMAGNVSFVFRAIGTDISGFAESVRLLGTGDLAGARANAKMFEQAGKDARAAHDAWEKGVMGIGLTGQAGAVAPKVDASAAAAAAARAAAFLKTGKDEAAALLKLYQEVSRLAASMDVNLMPFKSFGDKTGKDRLEGIKKTLGEGQKGWIAYADAVFAAADAENTANASGDSFTQTMEKLRETVRETVDPTYKLTKQFEALELAASTGWITQADANFAKLDERIRSLLKPTENIHESIQQAWEKGLLSDDQMKKAVDQWNDVNLKMKDVDNTAQDMGHAIGTAFEDAVTSGKKFGDILKALEQDIARIILRMTVTKPMEKAIEGFDFGKLFGGLVGGLFGGGGGDGGGGLSDTDWGFATGGAFTVPGSGGTDSQRVSFRATPGERVSVQTPAQQSGGGVTVIINQDNRGADSSIFGRLMAANDKLRRDVPAIVDDAIHRGVTVGSR